MAEDIIRTFGYLALGSRFRRIGERLQADTQQIIDRSGISIQAGQCPMLAAIGRHEAMTIGDLAEAVGISQPGVTRTISQLVTQGLVEMRTSEEDQRRKLVSLTAAGHDFVEYAHRELWPKIEAAVQDLCAELSGPLLDQLAGIEDGLAEKSLQERTKTLSEDTP